MIKIKDTSAQDIALTPKIYGRKFWIKINIILIPSLILCWILSKAIVNLISADISISRERLRMANVEIGDFTRDVTAQGKVIAAISPTLYAPTDGVITLHVKAGDTVIKGQTMAVLESPELHNRYAQEQATLDSLQIEVSRQSIQTKKALLSSQQRIDLAKVNLTAANREKRRAEISIEKQVISMIEFEKSKDDLNAAIVEHQHAVQDAALEKESLEFELQTKQLKLDRQTLWVNDLKRQIDNLNISSPVDGIIGSLATQQKAAVSRNTPLMTVVDLSAYEVEVNVPESYADDLGIGMTTEITFNQNTYTGELTALSPEVIGNQVTARMRFTGDSPKGLRQNQRVTTRILIENRQNILKVQRGSFLDSNAGRYAYLVKGDLAQRTPIQIGSRGINEVEILSGLNENDQIIISSTELFNHADIVYLTN